MGKSVTVWNETIYLKCVIDGNEWHAIHCCKLWEQPAFEKNDHPNPNHFHIIDVGRLCQIFTKSTSLGSSIFFFFSLKFVSFAPGCAES